jgi:hypothetical protein
MKRIGLSHLIVLKEVPLFKDVLDCDLEEYKSEIESMPEKGLELPHG